MKNQRATLEFRDQPDGTITINLTCKPSLRGDAKITPAVQAAIEAMSHIAQQAEKLISAKVFEKEAA
jgi:hypothetical protein